MIPASIRGRAASPAARTLVAGALAIIGGLALAYMDSRPGYDDTGVTAVMLIAVAAVAAAIGRTRPWLWAILVGAWTPIVEIGSGGSTGSLLAMIFAGLGSAIGYLAARGARSR